MSAKASSRFQPVQGKIGGRFFLGARPGATQHQDGSLFQFGIVGPWTKPSRRVRTDRLERHASMTFDVRPPRLLAPRLHRGVGRQRCYVEAMGPKPVAGSDDMLTQALDELYAAPFEGFVQLRKELSARLRSAGDVSGGRQVADAIKPTRTAWALNRIARHNPELVAAIAKSREAASTAQKNGDPSAIRDMARQYRDAIGGVVRAVRAILAADGLTLSAMQARRVAETLQALTSDEGELAKLTTGRLTRDVEVEDPFATVELGPGERSSSRPAPERKDVSTKRADEKAARAREAERLRDLRILQEKQRALEEARTRVTELDHAVAEARKVLMHEEREVKRAQYEADKANRNLADLSERLARARERLKKLQTA